MISARLSITTVLALSGVFGIACGGPTRAAQPENQPAVAQPSAGGQQTGMMAMCPMQVPDVHVSAADAPNGEAIVFTTTPANVDELRRRVDHMAQMHNGHPHGMMTGGGPGGSCPMMAGQQSSMGTGAQPGGMSGMMHADAHAENIANGAQLVLVASAPADLEALRTHVRAHVGEMQSGHCCAMEHGRSTSAAPGGSAAP